jgi:hypothetical protein
MRYMLLIYEDERNYATMTPKDMEASMGEWFAYTDAMKEAGAFQAGEPLQPTRTASTVRVKNGKTLTIDGPFAETKEQLGGFYLLDCKDLDEALEYAKRIPFQSGSVEVRPVMDYTEFGYEDPSATGATQTAAS